jgi:hypothetical protein
MFRNPFNSTEIGFHRVGAISLDPHVNLTQDVHSKCLLIPEAVRSGTKDDPDERFIDPVPEGVLDLMIPKKCVVGPYRILSPSEITIKMHQEFSKFFDGVEMPSWAIISLLRPGSDL